REKKTLEAKIFRQLDKLEMAIQALVYEKENHIKLDEFFINADLQIHSPFLCKIFEQIIKYR
ncbi:MAG: HD domain-containing protein, partial [Parcubacteria group bacterium]|nr:HD domain-containing protein [Parcubacteria group bacterium]